MTFTDGDAYCEDMDPENLAVVNTAKEPSAVGKWENRNDNIFEEEFNNGELNMTFSDGDAYWEDMDPENLAVVNTAKEPSSVEKWENRSDNNFEEEFNNVEDLCEDMEPGNLVTNEEAKDPTFIDKDMDESDGDMKEVNNMYSGLTRTYRYWDPWYRPLSFSFVRFSCLQPEKARLKQEEVIKMELQPEKARLKQEEVIKMKLQRQKARLKLQLEKARLKQEEVIKMELQREKTCLKQKELIKMKLQREKARLKQKELIKMKEEVNKIGLQCVRTILLQEIDENSITIPLPCESTRLTYEEVVKMKQEVIKILQEGITNLLEVIEEMMQEEFGMKERKNLFKVILTLLAYIVLLSSILSKSALQKQLRFKYSFGKAALLLLWTSGDVEKHPGPPLNDMKTIRELVTRLVKEVQGKKVVDWATAPPGWDENVVSFQDINKLKDSDNEEKYAMFYEALDACIKMSGHVPDWCVEEMTYVETGNVPELHKCQTVRKVRELLAQHSPADREDIIRRVRYPRQGGSVPAQAVKTTNRNQQSRQDKCPFNVPGYRPISSIKESDTARKIAKECIALSKNAGKYQSGNHQTMTKKRSATTTTVQPASKQPRTSAANTSTQPATSTIVRPNSASPAISIAICAQPVVNATASSKRLPATSTIVRPTTSTNSAVATACYTGSHSSTFCTSRASNNISTGTLPSTAQVSKHLNHDGQQSNDTSTGTHPNAAKNRQQPNRGGQPSNLISLPSDDLGDLGFSSNVDLDQFIKQIMKDGKM